MSVRCGALAAEILLRLPLPRRARTMMFGTSPISQGALTPVARHRTAIRRIQISRPIRLALQDSIINSQTSVLDYGCGQGDDIRALRERGCSTTGWDPFFFPDGDRAPADVVNLGYVVNVIEDAAERSKVLRDAWSYANKVLIVSARLTADSDAASALYYGDGHLTRLGTFQKLFEQQELRQWVDDELGDSCVAAAPGVFYVFRDADLKYGYLTTRVHRISARPKQHRTEQVFEAHKPLFEDLIGFFLARGRLPLEEELPSIVPLCREVGSVRRAFAIVRRLSGEAEWDRVRDERQQDLLVYLALARFSHRPKYSVLPLSLQMDLRAFFSTYTNACRAADSLLFSAGNRDIVEKACRTSSIGKLTRTSLYVHRSALEALDPVLRVYEGCARALVGTVDGANLLKLRFLEPMVSYLSYPRFEIDPHPVLASSVVVHLQTFKMHYRRYTETENPPLLHRKEEFVKLDDPSYSKYQRLTKQEEAKGLYEQPWLIGTRQGWNEILKHKRLRLAGHRLLRIAP